MEFCKPSRLVFCLAVILMSIGPGGKADEEEHQYKRTYHNEQWDAPTALDRSRRFAVRDHYIRRYMADHNGGTIQLTERAELLSLAPHGGPFPAKWRSSVTVRAPKDHVVRVQFLKVRPPPVPGICNQRMFLFDGQGTFFSRMLHEAVRPLCGDSVPFDDYISSGRPITLQFISDGLPLPNGRGFTASLTPIKTHGCREGDFHCKNGYCISKYLSCDGYNNCGDSSDELKCHVSGVSGFTREVTILTCLQWTTIILGFLGVVVIIIMLIWYIATTWSSPKPKEDYQHIDTPGNEKWNPNYYQ